MLLLIKEINGEHMKNDYTNALTELHKWIEHTDQNLGTAFPFLHTEIEVQRVSQQVYFIVSCINDEYPFYAYELPKILQNLFCGNPVNGFNLNKLAFAELFIIIKQLISEPLNTQFWTTIHPRISAISKSLYCDGHFDSAAEKAVKELETRLRELFRQLKPGAVIPAKIGEIIGALLGGDNGLFNFCDTSTVSGKDYRRGVKLLFDGIFAAYRNPASHANLSYTKREAIEQITFASQLMYILDKPQLQQF